jgi:hypothetical protein
MLQFLVTFFSKIIQTVQAETRSSWAKQVASKFSCVIAPQPWAPLFFELLLHAHGLYIESQIADNKRWIWSVDERVQSLVKEREKVLKTPRRKNSLSTPRKSVSRVGGMFVSMGKSVRRNLFGTKNNVNSMPLPDSILMFDVGPVFLKTRDGKDFKASGDGDDQTNLYSKRLRLK